MCHIISVITDETFITLGSKCYYRWDLYYTWVQNVFTDGTFITLGSKCHYRWDLYYTWVQMLLQMGPLLRSGLNAITNGTFITLGFKCYYRWDLYYTWVQLLHLCLLQIAWFVVIFGINTTSDISKFETILKYREWYLQGPRSKFSSGGG